MEMMNLLLVIFGLSTIYLFYKANTKSYSSLRKKEATRYFEGSVVNEQETFKERTYTHGLAFVVDKKTGQKKFKKQAKMCDSALLYS